MCGPRRSTLFHDETSWPRDRAVTLHRRRRHRPSVAGMDFAPQRTGIRHVVPNWLAPHRRSAWSRPGRSAVLGCAETVLLVEDQEEVRRFTSIVLQRLGYRLPRLRLREKARGPLVCGRSADRAQREWPHCGLRQIARRFQRQPAGQRPRGPTESRAGRMPPGVDGPGEPSSSRR